MNDLFTKAQGDTNLIPLLYMSSDELSRVATDETKPYYIRKIVEMLSSDNPSTSMSAIKFLKEEEKKLKHTDISTLIDQVISFGMHKYPIEKILNIIPDDVDKDEFTKQFNDPNHAIYKAYQKGKDRRDYDIDNNLLTMFKSNSDMKALEKYEERQFIRSKQKKKK